MQVSSAQEPITRFVVMTGKAIREAFEETLNREGTSLATWVILWRVEQGEWDSQRVLAKHLRIEGPTLTRQLHRMERELFTRIRSTAEAFGARTCEGLSDRDQATLRRLLTRINQNVGRRDVD